MEIGPGEIALASRIDLAVPARSWDNGALIAQALAASPELARLAALDASAAIDIEVGEHGVMPTLDVALNLGVTGTDDDPAGAAVNMVKGQEFTAIGSLSWSSSSRCESMPDGTASSMPSATRLMQFSKPL